MDTSACTDAVVTYAIDNTVAWEQATFPYRKNKPNLKITTETYKNMQMLKLLFKDMELRNGKEFVFYGYPSEAGITVKFKDEGTALIAYMRWLGSDWYNKKT